MAATSRSRRGERAVVSPALTNRTNDVTATATGNASPLVGEVVTALPLGRSVVVRLAHPVIGYPEQVALHSTHLVPSSDALDVRTPVVGRTCSLTSDHLMFGDWIVDRTTVTLGDVWEAAVLTIPEDATDPSTDPEAGLLLASLLSDAISAATDSEQASEPPSTLTTAPLTSPTLRISLRSEVGQHAPLCCEVFVADGMAIEWLRFGGGSLPVVSYFDAADLPLRVLERCGLGRLACVGRPSWQDQKVDIRCTHLSTDGLALEALTWAESLTGTVTTPGGPATPMGLASEVLRLLPGGDPHDDPSVDPATRSPSSATPDAPGRGEE
jgi:hypothetical protein